MNLWAFYLAVSFTLGAVALLLTCLLACALWRMKMPVYPEIQADLDAIQAGVNTLVSRAQGDPQAAQDRADTIAAVDALKTSVDDAVAGLPAQ